MLKNKIYSFSAAFLVATLTVLFSSSLYSEQQNKQHFLSGQFEGLMLAVDNNGKVTGHYEENQGEGVSKSCRFNLVGEIKSNEIDILTWSTGVFPGKIFTQKDGIKLQIEKGREHDGCALVLLPEISDGIDLERVKTTKWQEIRTISSTKSYFYSTNSDSKKLNSYLLLGDTFGVVSSSGDWLQIEYVGASKLTKGWIHARETKKLEVPSH